MTVIISPCFMLLLYNYTTSLGVCPPPPSWYTMDTYLTAVFSRSNIPTPDIG